MVVEKRRITIVGAGLSGCLLALMLGREKFEVDVYERRPDMRQFGFIGGRSINLALSHRGLVALDLVELRDELLKMVVPMRGRRIHNSDGSLSFQPYGKDETEVINSISREDLNVHLLNLAAEEKTVNFYFDHRCIKYDKQRNILHVQNEKGTFTVEPEVLVGADGAQSIVRRSMLSLPMFNYSQEFLDYGYKELEIPPGPGNSFRIEKNALHIWPREAFVMIALPNTDGSFTVTLFAPYEGEYGFETLETETDVEAYFNDHFPDASEHIVNLGNQFFHNPTGRLVTIKCDPWYISDRVILLGDAAHAIIPFYGQGMNAAFEDVRILVELIRTEESWKDVLQKFSRTRKPNADAIAQLSYDNFVEMRDKVADAEFLKRKKMELELYRSFPGEIISKYSMVTFHPEIPYKVAKKKGEILEQVIEELYSRGEFNVIDAYNKVKAEYEALEKQ